MPVVLCDGWQALVAGGGVVMGDCGSLEWCGVAWCGVVRCGVVFTRGGRYETKNQTQLIFYKELIENRLRIKHTVIFSEC